MIVLKKSPDQTGDRSENRRYARTKTSRTASLWSLDQRLITRASMVDMSAAGACLELASATALPSRFTIRLERSSGPDVRIIHCERVWQHEAMAGIRFCDGQSKATS
ncbi:PilZ domain-containing protein [Hyphomonas chukchiensis]|uniref:PilZ domain-containing protein n=1 Tax=Hyphomonas chukchiensis TaxID=1280947 RepID=A0A062UGR0_9PROT|nr:PilZ domain-containing protein [Hyphomonas chukchiensis]KCZ57512.1 hypothetical protein HY30_04895 [Hyphomonas chukchiensis]